MGCAPSNPEMKARSDDLSRELKAQKEKRSSEVKLLLLGAGGAGKSTIVRQLKIIHGMERSKQEKETYTEIVYYNIVKAMKTLILAADKFEYDLPDECEKTTNYLRQIPVQVSDLKLTDELAAGIKSLWESKPIKDTFARSSEFQLEDSAAYFFGSLDRITSDDYTPTDDDIVHVRAKTTGIIETEFEIKDLKFRLVDVGGQRNERKKWIHCFQEVTAIIFVTALSGYNLVLEEDPTSNRMHESLKLFFDVINNRWFQSTHIILFYNKMDLFKDKIEKQKIPLDKCFPDYDKELTYLEALKFIQAKFAEKDQKQGTRHIYTHETCAVDRKNVQVVFESVQDIFLTDSLRGAGFGLA